mmetsp:Transcript_17822/g.58226  ORF Transcript_17822/g.58226 Transcript_17822/m.58226 type:complete len:689 (-) Transcript_17822:932-2998(-)
MPTFAALAMAAVSSAPATLRPFSVDMSALSASRELAAALTSDGIIQVTSIAGYAELRSEVLAGALECNTFPESHAFEDGTTRRSIAARTVPGRGGVQPFPLDATSKCQAFESALAPFRALVLEATEQFASALSELLDVKAPLLSTPDGAHDFASFLDVVQSGDHLEHIHEYTKTVPPKPEARTPPTLDMHVDQGIFIAFTPALETEPSEFHVQRRTGETVRVDFDRDALVFMLGGGAEQIVSPKLRRIDGFVPRGTPHAVWVPPSSTPRMWYGRMVLPPPGAALAPGSSRTYGDLRTEMIRATSTGDDVATVGCLQPSLASANRRALSATSCTAGTEYCWHRCMELSPDVSSDTHDEANAAAADWKRITNSTDNTAACASIGLRLQCVGPRDLVSIGGHGDFYPACTNTTAPFTPYPAAFGPRDEATCTDAALEAQARSVPMNYGASADLMGYCDGVPCRQGVLQWGLDASDPEGKVDVQITYNGRLGWAAFGIANPGGTLNGMNGAHIAMLLPDSPLLYTPQHGLANATGPVIDEFIISERGTAFRLWNTPYPVKSLLAAGWAVDDCFTTLSFSTAALAGWPLDTAGSNKMLWAFNSADHYVGYHSGSHRGIVNVQWSDGAYSTTPEAQPSAMPTGALVAIIILAVLLALLVLLLVLAVVVARRGAAGDKSKSARAAADDSKLTDRA